MATSTKKTTDKEEAVVEETKNITSTKKSQKVKVLVSVYRVNDKIISALGIPRADASVAHRFPKDKLRTDDLFALVTQIKNHAPFVTMDSYKSVAEDALDEKKSEIVLPETPANKLQNIATFTHEILNIGIELFSS